MGGGVAVRRIRVHVLAVVFGSWKALAFINRVLKKSNKAGTTGVRIRCLCWILHVGCFVFFIGSPWCVRVLLSFVFVILSIRLNNEHQKFVWFAFL